MSWVFESGDRQPDLAQAIDNERWWWYRLGQNLLFRNRDRELERSERGAEVST
jgi:hypothetical protein